MGLFFPLILVFGIFYLLVFRPQQKRMKEHQAMIEGVKRGDTVVTTGGIIGKVVRVAEGELRVEVADGVQVRLVKGSISEVRGKGEPVKEKSKAERVPIERGGAGDVFADDGDLADARLGEVGHGHPPVERRAALPAGGSGD